MRKPDKKLNKRYLPFLLVLLTGLMLFTASTYIVFAPGSDDIDTEPSFIQVQTPEPTPEPTVEPASEPTPEPMPEPTPEPVPEVKLVETSRVESVFSVNGAETSFHAYEVDERIFLDLFEFSSALSGTEKQFFPRWSKSIDTIHLDSDSRFSDGEQVFAPVFSDDSMASPVDLNVFLGGSLVSISAYNIEGSIYFDFDETAEVLELIIYRDTTEDTIDIYTSQALVDSVARRQRIDPSLPMVALTFDDGPGKLTNQVLDILERYDAVATFYVIGMQVEDHSETILRAVNMGCEIANHSWSHRSLERISIDSVRTQLQTTNFVIESITGVAPVSMRPPFGRTNSNVQSISRDLGMSVVMWSVDPSDYLEKSAYSIYSHIMGEVRDRDIILLHDVYDRSIEATRSLVPELIERGFQLVTVSELLYFSDIEHEPGATYRHGRS